MIKADLHLHTREDPCDCLDYSAEQLLERAYGLNFGVLAVTLHGEILQDPGLTQLAESLGILLIPGVELNLQGVDVVVLNVTPRDILRVRTFGDLRALRRRLGETMLTIAPHPFYLFGGSIGKKIYDVMDCIDAIEMCRFHTRWVNPNRKAIAVAQRYGMPMVANSDAHQLTVFGKAYTELNVPDSPAVADVFTAIRANQVKLHCPPQSIGEFLGDFFFITVDHPVQRMLHRG